MNEKIKTIAEFDGYHLSATTRRGELYSKGGDNCFLHNMPYLTDLNALHKVALDVMDRLQAFNYYSDMIRNALTERPVNGQYTDLVDAVYEAIVYLKQHEQCH